MLILLPPSEGKTRPAAGSPLELCTLTRPELSQARENVLGTLIETSLRADGIELLKVSKRLVDEVVANRELCTAPTAPAVEIYSGVLYQALSPRSWEDDVLIRAKRQLVMFSALFGVLGPADRIPAYRLSAGVKLPGIGALPAFWRSQLDPVMGDHDLVVDCRSSGYTPMWKPRNIAPTRVFTELNGVRKVVSHLAKHVRGLVARALLSVPEPGSRVEAVELLNDWFSENRGTDQVPEQIWAQDNGSGIDVISRGR